MSATLWPSLPSHLPDVRNYIIASPAHERRDLAQCIVRAKSWKKLSVVTSSNHRAKLHKLAPITELHGCVIILKLLNLFQCVLGDAVLGAEGQWEAD